MTVLTPKIAWIFGNIGAVAVTDEAVGVCGVFAFGARWRRQQRVLRR